jgi:multidrug efflux pump subunit AcrB
MGDVATAISNNTVEQPVGTLQGTHQAYQIGANSQLLQVDALSKVIVATAMVRQCASASRSGGRRLRRATATRRVNNYRGNDRDLASAGFGHASAVDRIKAMLPRIEASIPPSVKLIVVSDRSLSISASIADAQLTLGVDDSDGFDQSPRPVSGGHAVLRSGTRQLRLARRSAP